MRSMADTPHRLHIDVSELEAELERLVAAIDAGAFQELQHQQRAGLSAVCRQGLHLIAAHPPGPRLDELEAWLAAVEELRRLSASLDGAQAELDVLSSAAAALPLHVERRARWALPLSVVTSAALADWPPPHPPGVSRAV